MYIFFLKISSKGDHNCSFLFFLLNKIITLYTIRHSETVSVLATQSMKFVGKWEHYLVQRDSWYCRYDIRGPGFNPVQRQSILSLKTQEGCLPSVLRKDDRKLSIAILGVTTVFFFLRTVPVSSEFRSYRQKRRIGSYCN